MGQRVLDVGRTAVDDHGVLPTLAPQQIGKGLADLPPRTMAFVVSRDAEAAACQ